MSNDPMREFHKLLKEERYREARGILETEPLDEKVVEKWTLWLDDVQRDERVQVGVQSEKSPLQMRRALNETYQMLGSVSAVVIAAGLCWIGIYEGLSTPSFAVTGPLAGIMMVAGIIGWQIAAKLFSPEHSKELGAVIAGGLLILLFSTGFPMYYYDDPPGQKVIAGFLLVYPLVAYLLWHGTAFVLKHLVEFFSPSGIGMKEKEKEA